MTLVYDETQLREPNLLVPGKPPIGPVRLNKAHSIARAMVLCIVGDRTTDLALGAQGQLTGTPVATREVVNGRKCIQTLNTPTSAGGSSALYFPDLRLGSKFTVAVQCRWGTTDARKWNRIISGKPVWNHTNGFEITLDDDLHQYVAFRCSSSASVSEISFLDSTNGWNDNLIESLAFTAEDTAAKLYNKGTLRKSGTVTALANTNSGVAIGSDGDLSEYSFYGQFFYVYIWDRVLSPVELFEVYRDPYQFLEAA